MTIFEEVKAQVDVPTAAGHYGIEVHRNGMALCPFHQERHPSCRLYPDHYHCYGCGAHGDVIHLVGALFGLSPMEAVKQLCADFGLCPDVEKPPDYHRRVQARKEQQAYEGWEQHAFQTLTQYLWMLRDFKELYQPQSPDVPPDARFAYAMQNLEYAEFLSEEYLRATKEEKLSMKEEVTKIERELAKYHPDDRLCTPE